MRVIALLLAVALIVVGGFWLARDRTPESNAGSATETATQSSSESNSASAAGETASDDPATDAEGAEDQAERASEASTEAADETPESGADAADESAADAADEADAADTDAPDAQPSTPASDSAEEDAADAGSEDEEAVDGVADLASALPEGYEPVAYLSDTPRRVFEAAGEVLEPATDYVAVLRTNRGDFVADLYEDRTPETVNNFIFLALNRYYQGVPFHRVLEDFMAQTGDPTGTGSGGPGYQFEDEFLADLQFDRAGLLAMANAGPGTNGSQFFITFAPTPWLNGAHTIFGELLAGEELLPEIARVDPSNPSAVVMPDDTLADLATQGIELPGDDDATVEEAIAGLLGTTPVAGQSFTVAGYRGVLGQVGGGPAYGFFQQPDTLLNVLIGKRPAS